MPGGSMKVQDRRQGGWIKMQAGLVDHPKVVAMTRLLVALPEFRAWSGMSSPSVTLASRCCVTGLLLRAWSNAREHGKFVGSDLVLEHSELEDLDQLAGAPGVGKALEQVGWARAERGVTLPNFSEFNVPKSDAERARDYRNRRANEQRIATGDHADVTQTSRTTRDEDTEIVTPRGEESNYTCLAPGGGSALPDPPSPPMANRTPPRRTARKRPPRVESPHGNWVPQILAAWNEETGGTLIPGRVGRDMKPLIDLHGVEKVVEHLRCFCRETPPQFRTLNKFIEGFGAYDPAQNGRRTKAAHGGFVG